MGTHLHCNAELLGMIRALWGLCVMNTHVLQWPISLCIGRHISRCLQLLITEGTSVLNTLEMPHCKDVLPWVRQWNDPSHLWHQGSLPRLVALFGLDIKALFPSLDKQDVWDSITEIAHLVSRAPGPTGEPRRGTLHFAINRTDRNLDRIGSGSADLFHNIPIDNVVRYVYLNVLCNDTFVFSNHVLRQKQGLAIGGPCSSQLASAKCMLSEHRFYAVWLPVAPSGAQRNTPALSPQNQVGCGTISMASCTLIGLGTCCKLPLKRCTIWTFSGKGEVTTQSPCRETLH